MWEFIYVGIREQYYHFFTSPPLPSTPGAEQFLHFSKVKTPLFLHFSKVKPYIFLHFYKNSLREKIGRISDDAVFYLMSRGISEEEARAMIVSGFADNVSKELPLEYAVEMNNLIRLEMQGSIG